MWPWKLVASIKRLNSKYSSLEKNCILTILSNRLEGKNSWSCPHHLGKNGNSRPGGRSPGREFYSCPGGQFLREIKVANKTPFLAPFSRQNCKVIYLIKTRVFVVFQSISRKNWLKFTVKWKSYYSVSSL